MKLFHLSRLLPLAIVIAIILVREPLVSRQQQRVQYLSTYVTYIDMKDGLIYSQVRAVAAESISPQLNLVLVFLLLALALAIVRRRAIGPWLLCVLAFIWLNFSIYWPSMLDVYPFAHLGSVQYQGLTYNLAYKSNHENGSSYYLFECRDDSTPCHKIASFVPDLWDYSEGLEAELEIDKATATIQVVLEQQTLFTHQLKPAEE